MAGPADQIGVGITADTVPFEQGMKRAMAQNDGFLKSLFKVDQGLQKMAMVAGKGLMAVTAGLNSVEAAARGSQVSLAAVGTTLLGAFAMGGGPGLLIAGIGSAIGGLIGSMKQAEEQAAKTAKATMDWLKGMGADAEEAQKRIAQIKQKQLELVYGSERAADMQRESRMRDVEGGLRAAEAQHRMMVEDARNMPSPFVGGRLLQEAEEFFRTQVSPRRKSLRYLQTEQAEIEHTRAIERDMKNPPPERSKPKVIDVTKMLEEQKQANKYLRVIADQIRSGATLGAVWGY